MMSWFCGVFGHAWRNGAGGVAEYCARCQAVELWAARPAQPRASEHVPRVRFALKPVVYVAHPLGSGDARELNRTNATQWCAYLAEYHGIAPVAPWIVISGVWDESKRAAGLEIDLAIVERCDELWLVGGGISEGMTLEASHARNCGITVRDLTALGYLPPLDLAELAPKGGR